MLSHIKSHQVIGETWVLSHGRSTHLVRLVGPDSGTGQGGREGARVDMSTDCGTASALPVYRIA